MKRFWLLMPLICASVAVCDEWWQEDIPKRNLGQMQNDGEFRVIQKFIKSGDIVFDGGANVGLWSAQVVKTKKDVAIYAFEPTPESFEKAKKKLAETQVKLFQLALAETDGEKVFFCYPGGSQYYNSFFDWMGGKQKQKVKVQCRSIDSFCEEHDLDHIDFLKLDVEGAEFVALTGARQMLEAHKVKFVQFEYNNHPKANLKGIYQLLTGLGYRLYKILSNKLKPIPAWNGKLADRKFINYLAVLPGIPVRGFEMEE